MQKKIMGLSLFALISCQGGVGTEENNHYTVQSTPIICDLNPIGLQEVTFCANTSTSNTHVIETGGSLCFGFKPPEWGVTYQITLKEQRRYGGFDGCSVISSLVSIDAEIPDPIGTRYTSNVGSYLGGLTITRLKADEPWFQLSGYQKPIFCADTLCGSAEVGVKYQMGHITQMPYVFELVEKDGKREIEIKPQ